MRSGVVALMLASCGPSSAIEVVVDPPADPEIDTVKIYVGLGYRLNESGNEELLVPRGYHYPELPKGLRFKRERELESDTLRVADGLRWVFQPGTHDEISVIAIGYANGEMRAAGAFHEQTMQSGTVVERHIALAPARAPFPIDNRLPTIVQEWGPDPESRACAHYKDADQSIYIVDKDDRDCDGLIEDEPECRNDVFAGYKREMARDKATCLRPEPTVPGACVLGAVGCTEQADACNVPTTTCMEPDSCLKCATNPGGVNALSCAAALANTATTNTRLQCDFFYSEITGQICGTKATLQNDPFSRVDVMCDPTKDYVFYQPFTQTWTSSVISRGALKFTAAKPTLSCGFELLWEQPVLPTAPPENILALANGPLQNGRSVAIPLNVNVRAIDDCANAETTCRILNPQVPTPAFVKCLATPILDPW